MIRVMALLMFVAALTLLSSCGAGGGIPSSSISIYDVEQGRLISTARTTGDLTLTEGQEYAFRVMRLTADDHDTNSSEVTTVCRFYFIPEGIAEADSLGRIRALKDGTTRMEARFRTSGLSEADHVYLNIRVNKAAEGGS